MSHTLYQIIPTLRAKYPLHTDGMEWKKTRLDLQMVYFTKLFSKSRVGLRLFQLGKRVRRVIYKGL